MQDGIIKGTGNSRYLKSVSDFLTRYPSYADFAAALIAGTLPIDLAGINADGWQQLATALSKANLLSDATAAKFFASVTGEETPDQVLSKLGAAALKDGTAIKDPLGNLITIPSAQLDSRVQIYHTNYTGTGTYGSSNPKSIVFPFHASLVLVIPRQTSDYGFGIFVPTALTGDYVSRGYIYAYASPISAAASECAKIVSFTLSFYSTSIAHRQLNASDIVYDVIAIG